MEVRYRDMTSHELAQSSRMVMQVRNVMPYRKLDDGNYETYCYTCMTKDIVSYKKLREIQHSQHCPMCNCRFYRTTKKVKGIESRFVCIDDIGYCIDVKYDFDDVKVLWHEQMADFRAKTRGGHIMAIKRGYKLNSSHCFYRHEFMIDGSYIARYRMPEWKYRYNMFEYNDDMFTLLNGNPQERKALYTKYCNFITKSNQIKLAVDNRLTPNQCRLMKVFDLNNYEDVLMYKHLLNDYDFYAHLDDFLDAKIQLNIFYLDYLNRTKIDLGKYYHYLQNLNALGWKYDKPKTKDDFEYRLETTNKMIQEMKDELINKRITERYNSLPKYESDNVIISPFDNAEAIRCSGKQLHNCIGGYVERYSEGICDLYYMNIDNKLVVNMEIRDNRLVQARTDHNGKCPDYIQTHIVNFCNANNIEHFYNI